jgi:polyferredoxin
VDALCPFGAVESFWSLLTNGAYLKRVTASSLVLLVGTLLLTLIFRRAFCGQICPLGFLQELFGKLGRKLFGNRRPQLWGWVDRLARNLKYLVLVGVAILSWVLGELIVRPYDPWASWMHLTSPELLRRWAGVLQFSFWVCLGAFLKSGLFAVMPVRWVPYWVVCQN